MTPTIGSTADFPVGENPICSQVGAPVGINDHDYRKSHIQIPTGTRCRIWMKKNGDPSRRRRFANYAAAAIEQMKVYCTLHPGSPSAVRRPQLFFRGELWIAVLGPSVEEGIVGIGPTVAAALRAFDSQYLAGLRPRVEATRKVGKLRRSEAAAQRTYGSPNLT
jgi:hypothetical protein